MDNKEKSIILSDSKGIIHIYDSKNNFEEKLTIEFTKDKLNGKNNEINFISLKNQNEL